MDPREYSRQYEARLRQAEAASVQDYIAESGNLAALHSQARGGRRGRRPSAGRRGWTRLTHPLFAHSLDSCLRLPQIKECDDILGQMEGMLGRFQVRARGLGVGWGREAAVQGATRTALLGGRRPACCTPHA